MFWKGLTTLLSSVGVGCVVQWQALASPYSTRSHQIIDCGTGGLANPLTVYVSKVPRIYSQRLFLKNPGTFIVTASVQNFTFEGYAYVRNNLTLKWELVAKSPPGRKTWERIWHVTRLEGMSEIQMRMIKDDNGCKGCVITMNVTSKCL